MNQPLDIGTALVASIALGIAVDDTIHMLANYQRYRAEGVAPGEALKRTLEVTGVALVSTTLILVLGFGTFAFGTFMPNVFFGILTAVVLFAGLVVDIVFLPALLLVLHHEKATGDEKS
jgi:predicted RND superfamily exporter protein